MGTPQFAVPSLEMLIGEGYDVAAVVTQPDRPKGRGGRPAPPIVKDIALKAGIRVFQPEKPSDVQDEITMLRADLFITAAYGRILKKKFLRIPRGGVVNVHASLLPRHRGPSPIHYALLNGDAKTGVTTMLTDAGIDTGPILLSKKMPIHGDMYFDELHDKLAALGADVLKKTIPAYLAGEIEPMPQDAGLASYAPAIQKTDAELDFNLSAGRLANIVRAFCVWPVASACVGGKKIKIYRAHAGGATENRSCAPGGDLGVTNGTLGVPGGIAGVSRAALSIYCGGGGTLEVTKLQFENGRVMDISECWHNLRLS